MTKEQEEAIEYLKNYRYDNEVYNAINIVLSMLEEKDKEILQLKKGINSLMLSRKKWKNRYYKTRNKLKEKDKIIDLMAEFIVRTDTKDICNNIEQHCVEYAGENKMTCDECIKKYFENKVKEK